ncbi:MAG: DUF1934 domain-containing protein [Faecalibacterium sp.]|nr:DUF1934 domain-containing protein [Faecalibacterium sp.]
MNLKEDYMIRIKSCIEQDGESQDIDLMTRGSFLHKGGYYYITYIETETSGYPGCTTTLKVAEDQSKVALLRFGQAASQLLIERGRRHLCHYETGYGSLTLGVTADEIVSELNEKGGTVRFSYLLDAGNAELMSKSSLTVTVTHIN